MNETEKVLRELLNELQDERQFSIGKRHLKYYRGYNDALKEANYRLLCKLVEIANKKE